MWWKIQRNYHNLTRFCGAGIICILKLVIKIMSDNREPTIQDVLDAMAGYAESTEGRLKNIETEVGGIKKEVVSIKSQMVTKSYLDDKLADLRGDLTLLIRKEDTKLKSAVNILADKKVLSQDDTKKIFSMEPFPQLAL